MQAFPHHYRITLAATPGSAIPTQAEGLPVLPVAAPATFDGPGDCWSPEELLLAALGNCLVLSFQAIARASSFEWVAVHCESRGVLDRPERQIEFTAYHNQVVLTLPAGADQAKAMRLLEKAEASCFIRNALKAPVTMGVELREA